MVVSSDAALCCIISLVHDVPPTTWLCAQYQLLLPGQCISLLNAVDQALAAHADGHLYLHLKEDLANSLHSHPKMSALSGAQAVTRMFLDTPSQ